MEPDEKPEPAWLIKDGATTRIEIPAIPHVAMCLVDKTEDVLETGKLYRRKESEPWPAEWTLEVCLDGSYVYVIVTDEFPTILALWAHVRALEVAEALRTTATIVERAFRAWHGHGAEAVCGECDPIEHRRRAEERAAARARREAREASKVALASSCHCPTDAPDENCALHGEAAQASDGGLETHGGD